MQFLRQAGMTLEIGRDNITITQQAFHNKFADIVSLTDLLKEERIMTRIVTRGTRMKGTERYEHKLNSLIQAIREAEARHQHGIATEAEMAQQRKDKS